MKIKKFSLASHLQMDIYCWSFFDSVNFRLTISLKYLKWKDDMSSLKKDTRKRVLGRFWLWPETSGRFLAVYDPGVHPVLSRPILIHDNPAYSWPWRTPYLLFTALEMASRILVSSKKPAEGGDSVASAFHYELLLFFSSACLLRWHVVFSSKIIFIFFSDHNLSAIIPPFLYNSVINVRRVVGIIYSTVSMLVGDGLYYVLYSSDCLYNLSFATLLEKYICTLCKPAHGHPRG